MLLNRGLTVLERGPIRLGRVKKHSEVRNKEKLKGCVHDVEIVPSVQSVYVV